MKQKTKIRIFSFWAASLVVAVGFIIKANNRADGYKQNISQIYAGNMAQLNESIYGITTELEKIVYTSSPSQIERIAVNISKRSAVAKGALSALPSGEDRLNQINKFLSQVGDYASYLSQKASNSEHITDSERQNLESLRDAAKKLSQSVDVAVGNFSTADAWSDAVDGITSSQSYGESFNDEQLAKEDYPTLIYDGPFSDNIDKKESQMLKNANSVDEKAALKTAAGALGITPNNLQLTGAEKGKIEAYCFSGQDSCITVTKKGGYVLYFRKSRTIGDKNLTAQQAIGAANEYLKSYGKEFEQSYYFIDEGVCTINFAYKQGDTICYTDLIKVGVAMDTGEIVLLEARGFIMNHRERSIVVPKHTKNEALEAINSSLEPKSVDLALIPSPAGNEIHCYEVLCEDKDGKEVLIYLNVTNLREEQILILLKTDGGTLVK